MNEFGLKGSITDKNFMIHVLNNFPQDYNVILDGLENCLMVTGDNALNINVICIKLSHWYEKIKNEKRRK